MGVLEYSAERHIQVIKDESYSMGLEDKEKELRPIIDNLTSENTFISEKNASLSKTNTSLTEKNASLSKANTSLTEKNAALTGENAYLRKLLEEHGIQP